ncbi:hypothetical protein WA158_003842 [Blastocystis sp. Blastoise]
MNSVDPAFIGIITDMINDATSNNSLSIHLQESKAKNIMTRSLGFQLLDLLISHSQLARKECSKELKLIINWICGIREPLPPPAFAIKDLQIRSKHIFQKWSEKYTDYPEFEIGYKYLCKVLKAQINLPLDQYEEDRNEKIINEYMQLYEKIKQLINIIHPEMTVIIENPPEIEPIRLEPINENDFFIQNMIKNPNEVNTYSDSYINTQDNISKRELKYIHSSSTSNDIFSMSLPPLIPPWLIYTDNGIELNPNYVSTTTCSDKHEIDIDNNQNLNSTMDKINIDIDIDNNKNDNKYDNKDNNNNKDDNNNNNNNNNKDDNKDDNKDNNNSIYHTKQNTLKNVLEKENDSFLFSSSTTTSIFTLYDNKKKQFDELFKLYDHLNNDVLPYIFSIKKQYYDKQQPKYEKIAKQLEDTITQVLIMNEQIVSIQWKLGIKDRQQTINQIN